MVRSFWCVDMIRSVRGLVMVVGGCGGCWVRCRGCTSGVTLLSVSDSMAWTSGWAVCCTAWCTAGVHAGLGGLGQELGAGLGLDARGDDRYAHLVPGGLVEHRAEEDLGVLGHGLGDGGGGFVHFLDGSGPGRR